MYPNLLSLRKTLLLLYRLKNKTGCCCSYKICFSQETQRQMKFQWKMQEKWEKNDCRSPRIPGKRSWLFNLHFEKRYLIIWKTYSTQNKNPLQFHITRKVHSTQSNANLTKEYYIITCKTSLPQTKSFTSQNLIQMFFIRR